MLAIKAENVVVFIAREREDIARLWDELYIGPEERARCTVFQTDDVSEETLLAHETERHRLEQELADRSPILGLLGKYFTLIQEMRELEVRARDVRWMQSYLQNLNLALRHLLKIHHVYLAKAFAVIRVACCEKKKLASVSPRRNQRYAEVPEAVAHRYS